MTATRGHETIDPNRPARRATEPVAITGFHIMVRALPPSVATARRFVRGTLAGLGLDQVIDDAVLMADELVTNSVNATGAGVSWVTVSLYLHRAHLAVEVWDASPDRPTPRQPGETETHGRGLMIVEALSQQWGCRWPATGGKTLWARIPLDAPSL